MRSHAPKFVLTIIALATAFLPAKAATITILPGAGLSGNAAALAAFNRAAAAWESVLTDSVLVSINADLGVLGSGILGSASSVFLAADYTTIANAMVADAANELDDAIVGSLPTVSQFGAYLPAGTSLSGDIALTKANAKALGFAGLDGAFGVSDGTITFNSAFGFDYDNSDGVTGIDFESVALHEIGHTLGFVSMVDDLDAGTLVVDILPLDLFRFNTLDLPTDASTFTNNPRDFRPGQNAFTSDVVNAWRMSTGSFGGDGRQASHWKDDGLTGLLIGALDPNIGAGSIFSLSQADIRALDLIGWEAQSVPEPATTLLVAAGIAGMFWKRRRLI